MIDAMPVRRVDLGDDVKAFKERLIAENHYAWGGREIVINNEDENENESGNGIRVENAIGMA
jgi:hypothetical protein